MMPGTLARHARRIAGRVRSAMLPNPRLTRWEPRSTLRLPEHPVARARYPAIDVHNHLGRWLTRDGSWMAPDAGRLVAELDRCNIAGMVNLDGRWGQELEENLRRYDRAYPGRFATFCHVDWRLAAGERAGDRLAASLRESVARGAQGLKVWKDLGREVRDGRGRLVLPDDERLAPLWEAAADAAVPVLIHVADPVAYFQPVDRRNERLEELRRSPRSSWHRPGLPSHERLIQALDTVAGRHPRTTWIAAHVASSVEDLACVGELLRRHRNLVADIAARIHDLGRQPRAARALFTGHPDRILFGTDVFPMHPGEVAVYFRCLETADECFPYSAASPPRRGRWQVSGLDLPDAVLRCVYAGNARRLLPTLRAG